MSWSSKKQHTVAKSSTEAEYKSLSLAAAEISWIQMILYDLQVQSLGPPTLYCDNISAISLASNPIFHARSKHIEVDFHFVRERIARKELQVSHVSSVDQIADILTKALQVTQFNYLKSKLNVIAPTVSLRGPIEEGLAKMHAKSSNDSKSASESKAAAKTVQTNGQNECSTMQPKHGMIQTNNELQEYISAEDKNSHQPRNVSLLFTKNHPNFQCSHDRDYVAHQYTNNGIANHWIATIG